MCVLLRIQVYSEGNSFYGLGRHAYIAVTIFCSSSVHVLCNHKFVLFTNNV